MNPTTEQKYINKIRELEKRVEKLEQHTNECICRGSVHIDDIGRYDPYTDSFARGKAE